MPEMNEATTRPTPDPTVLTTEQLLREVENAVKLLEAKIHGQEQVCNEQFRSVALQLDLVERQRVEQKKDTKDAVDAALTAQKESVGEQRAASELAIAKSEAAMIKQLEQLSTTFTTAIAGVGDRLAALESRLDRIESAKQGGREATTERRESLAGLYAFCGFVVSLLVIGGILAAAGAFG